MLNFYITYKVKLDFITDFRKNFKLINFFEVVVQM